LRRNRRENSFLSFLRRRERVWSEEKKLRNRFSTSVQNFSIFRFSSFETRHCPLSLHTMRSAFATSSALSAPCHSGRRIECRRSDVHVARAMKMSPAASSAVAVSLSSSSLDLLSSTSLAPLPSSSFRSPVATRRRRLRPSLIHSQATPGEGSDGAADSGSSSEESKAPLPSSPKSKKKTSVSSSSSSSSKSASPLGDLMAMLLPVQKRKSGSKGPPPPTLPQRWRAIKGSARVATEQAWVKAL